MTLREAIDHAARRLDQAGVDSPRLEAELLLEHVLGIPRLRLIVQSSDPLSPEAAAALEQFVARRATRVPLQHLTGWAPFLEHRLQVTRDTLIPRPETEQLAGFALDRLRPLAAVRGGKTVQVLDLGTGTGCLALALAAAVPTARVTAIEISPPAAEVARRNFAEAGVAGRVELIEGDGFLVVPALGRRFDLIVTNPPYLPNADIAGLAPEVRDHDPHVALAGGADGLDCYRRLAEIAGEWLEPDGWLLAEFGDDQAPALSVLFARHGWKGIQVEKDLSGRDRVLIVRPPSAT